MGALRNDNSKGYLGFEVHVPNVVGERGRRKGTYGKASNFWERSMGP